METERDRVRVAAYVALKRCLALENPTFLKGGDDLQALAGRMVEFWRAEASGEILTGNLIDMMTSDTERLMSAFGLTLHEQGQLTLMVAELVGGREKFGRYQTRHEALGVILEEFDEFKAEIYKNHTAAARVEARQVAATALRFCFEFSIEERTDGKET